MAKTKKTDIQNSLMEQLALLGAAKPHFEDLINDYMSLWDTKKLLQQDIKSRGIVYEEWTATGNKVKKNNPSVKDLVTVNKQMLSLLKELGLSTANAGDNGDDDL